MQIAIDKVYFKEILLRDKRFLYDLYQNNKLQNQNQIVGANEFHLDTLIKIFHLILNNTIPILEQNFEKVKKARKVSLFKKHFKSNKDFANASSFKRRKGIYFEKIQCTLLQYFGCFV